MKTKNPVIMMIAMIVALGGLLMGFDASVISGVIKFIEPEFGLTKLQLGWSVASLTVTATLAMLVAGPLSDKIGQKNGAALRGHFICRVCIRIGFRTLRIHLFGCCTNDWWLRRWGLFDSRSNVHR